MCNKRRQRLVQILVQLVGMPFLVGESFGLIEPMRDGTWVQGLAYAATANPEAQ